VYYGVVRVNDLVLIIFSLDPLPICATCLIGTGEWIDTHGLPRDAQTSIFQPLPLGASGEKGTKKRGTKSEI
jgi:hypothetical protein